MLKSKYHSVAILTCYYGAWPWYFPYFLHTCKFNPTIDFIIITDNAEAINNKPANVFIVVKKLEDIKKRAKKVIKFDVLLETPYKLCDFKPAYGLIFSDLIKGYDFWGHGDIDVIYGNIRGFVTKKMLSEYELITGRHDFLSGAFTLFKNNSKMNKLFMKSRDYKTVFTNKAHFCFDECNFLWKEIGELRKGQTIFDLPYHIESMTHVVLKLQQANEIKAFFDFIIIEGIAGHLKWKKGRLYYKNKFEAMLYHLIKFKKVNRPSGIFSKMPIAFNISSAKIYINNRR